MIDFELIVRLEDHDYPKRPAGSILVGEIDLCMAILRNVNAAAKIAIISTAFRQLGLGPGQLEEAVKLYDDQVGSYYLLDWISVGSVHGVPRQNRRGLIGFIALILAICVSESLKEGVTQSEFGKDIASTTERVINAAYVPVKLSVLEEIKKLRRSYRVNIYEGEHNLRIVVEDVLAQRRKDEAYSSEF